MSYIKAYKVDQMFCNTRYSSMIALQTFVLQHIIYQTEVVGLMTMTVPNQTPPVTLLTAEPGTHRRQAAQIWSGRKLQVYI